MDQYSIDHYYHAVCEQMKLDTAVFSDRDMTEQYCRRKSPQWTAAKRSFSLHISDVITSDKTLIHPV